MSLPRLLLRHQEYNKPLQLTPNQLFLDRINREVSKGLTDSYVYFAMVGAPLLGKSFQGVLGNYAHAVFRTESFPLRVSRVMAATGGFGVEVLSFEALHRSLRVLIGGADPSLLSREQFWAGVRHSGPNLLLLKAGGHITRGQPYLVSHWVGDLAMVTGNRLVGESHGSFIQDFLHADILHWQMKAGLSLLHGSFPGFSLQTQSLSLFANSLARPASRQFQYSFEKFLVEMRSEGGAALVSGQVFEKAPLIDFAYTAYAAREGASRGEIHTLRVPGDAQDSIYLMKAQGNHLVFELNWGKANIVWIQNGVPRRETLFKLREGDQIKLGDSAAITFSWSLISAALPKGAQIDVTPGTLPLIGRAYRIWGVNEVEPLIQRRDPAQEKAQALALEKLKKTPTPSDFQRSLELASRNASGGLFTVKTLGGWNDSTYSLVIKDGVLILSHRSGPHVVRGLQGDKILTDKVLSLREGAVLSIREGDPFILKLPTASPARAAAQAKNSTDAFENPLPAEQSPQHFQEALRNIIMLPNASRVVDQGDSMHYQLSKRDLPGGIEVKIYATMDSSPIKVRRGSDTHSIDGIQGFALQTGDIILISQELPFVYSPKPSFTY